MSVSHRGRLVLVCGVLVLSGCAVTATTPLSDQGARATQAVQLGRNAPALSTDSAPPGMKRGLYVLASSAVLGFGANDRSNRRPFCSLGDIASQLVNIAFDTKGRMIVPDYASSTITVYAGPTGPQACGKKLGVIHDRDGQPVDAASLDAASGRIVVAANSPHVDVCSLRRGCTKSLTAPLLDIIASVALSRNGDCWAEGDEVSGPGGLYYFKGCNTDGVVATGYFSENDNYGGIDVDKHGNILSIVANYHNSPALYVYSGCNPACTMLSGPLPLKGTGTYGHLNADSTEFAAADSQNSSIDVYKYSPTSLTYEYSISRGLSAVAGVAFNPPADQ